MTHRKTIYSVKHKVYVYLYNSSTIYVVVTSSESHVDEPIHNSACCMGASGEVLSDTCLKQCWLRTRSTLHNCCMFPTQRGKGHCLQNHT